MSIVKDWDRKTFSAMFCTANTDFLKRKSVNSPLPLKTLFLLAIIIKQFLKFLFANERLLKILGKIKKMFVISKERLKKICKLYMICILFIFKFFSFDISETSSFLFSQETSSSVRMTAFRNISQNDLNNGENSQYYICGQREGEILQRLQTSIIRLANRINYPHLEVDLVGAIHYGDIEYYKTLSRQLESYEIVLYEMVYMNKSQEPNMKFPLEKCSSAHNGTLSGAFKNFTNGPRDGLRSSAPDGIPLSRGNDSDFGNNFSRVFPFVGRIADNYRSIKTVKYNCKDNYTVFCGELKEKTRSTLPLYWFGKAQNWIGNNLKLASQTEHIDYSRKNMYHADIDAETLTRRYVESGDLNDLVLRVVIEGFLGQSKASEVSWIGILFARNRLRALKRTVAESLLTAFVEDIKGSSENVIIAERNQIVLKSFDSVLRQVKDGKLKFSFEDPDCKNTAQENGSQEKGKGVPQETSPLRIAIFYGCAHLPDFVDRLKKEYGFTPEKISWVTAWEMSEK